MKLSSRSSPEPRCAILLPSLSPPLLSWRPRIPCNAMTQQGRPSAPQWTLRKKSTYIMLSL